ncbi:mycothiol system anti-sigma-R factor [Thermosporothrix hazakensis]|jgi:mycothiol system anti-sigma-R factor|uniref:Mycothiol system anti-sigma-R factor n=1 Tax=Thermosporothrix hazakensis TaxID=644383 RepID=A0A326UFT0_THEHA|nr:zf-HC2 domain-containing protein [Thermosporothrix hazakensis]PZW35870.1 mycothiol system anti-sigma-R factor [Thermosporothrix hazakensis]GCE46523.1 hypothetical protein KTH_13920 [Thermosporothrix hazakensis]
MDCLNCYEISARLHLYIDRELSAEEIEIVQQHLEDCPSCQCRFHFDMRLKRLVHDCCKIQGAPEHLREAVLRIARTPRGKTVEMAPELLSEIQADMEGR